MSDEDFSTEAKTNMRARSHRRDNLLQLIGKNGGDIPKDHLLGVFMMRDHVSLSTTYEYLQELKMARLVVESNGHIISMELHLKEQKEDMERLKELVEKPEEEEDKMAEPKEILTIIE